MNILMVSSEVKPFSVSGGLGDVMGALPQKIKNLNNDIRIITPMYKGIYEKYKEDLYLCIERKVEFIYGEILVQIYSLKFNGIIHYFIKNDYFYCRNQLYGFNDDGLRFGFFSKVIVEVLKDLEFKPNVIHCNDWQTALVPVYINKDYKNDDFYKNIKVLFTIHNLQYQGIFEKGILQEIKLEENYFTSEKLEFYGNVNYLKAGIVYSDYLNTVSERYSKEIQTEEYGFGLSGVIRKHREKLTGIINGIAYETNNPATDDLPINFDKNSIEKKEEGRRILRNKLGLPQCDLPLVVLISRLAYQKGIDLIPYDIEKLGIQLVILGTGESKYEEKIQQIEQYNYNNVRAIVNYDEKIANELYAYGDFFLMPSLFEPCGLSQLYAMRYGTVPIVRKTGGLRDTVKRFNEEDYTGTGIVFNHYLESGLIWGVQEAIRLFNDKNKWYRLVRNCMEQDFSWESSAIKYFDLYKKIIEM